MWAIKERREELGMTQTELAQKVGVEQSSVARWERGATSPTAANLMKLSQVLNCTLDRLAGLDG